uniref:Uncharacterized protein n=1 Tax=Xenopus tropicalis TaxID=8364 RepID=A0A1B8Y9V7_XENTR
MASKTNVKTYEKGYRKNGKQQDSDASNISLPHKPTSLKTPLTEDYSLIAAEVARLINPVIEVTIEKAIDKLQINIINIFEQLSNHEKRLDEFDLTDYSLFLSQKSKVFSKVCQVLINRNINFSLMYPAKLKIFLPSGTRVFNDPLEASTFVNYLERKEVTKTSLDGKIDNTTKIHSNSQRACKYDKPRHSKISEELKPTTLQTHSNSRSRSLDLDLELE